MRRAVLIAAASFVILACALFIFLRGNGSAPAPRVTLLWTAPGDDGAMGRAAIYTMRYSRHYLGADTLTWWIGGTPVTGLPKPAPSGAPDSVEVTLPAWGTTYQFVLTACDEAGNCSGWSNVTMATTGPEPIGVSLRRMLGLGRHEQRKPPWIQ
ncbi:MAG TPA: hypothetical protein VK527_02350 [Candidatus Limnocylindrales bacterium]|nr:hypothetical protein [Candidatus Limnocylindrales bacterium]